MIKIINDNDYKDLGIRILIEGSINDYSLKKKVHQFTNNLKNIDLSEDQATEGMYYFLSSLLSISIIMSKSLIVGRLLAAVTAKHLNTKTLPKYREKLESIYKNKLNSINDKIESLEDELRSESRPAKKDRIQEQINGLNSVKLQLKRDIARLNVINAERGDV